MNLPSFLQALLPQRLLSRVAGFLASCHYKPLKNWLIKAYIAWYKVDMQDAIESNPQNYENLNAFFTRALKPERRPIAPEPYHIICPVDGIISQRGKIIEGQLLQAKRSKYDLFSLLGGSARLTKLFQESEFITFYLSPKDYHRVHAPLAGRLREMIYVPGRLFSVNNQIVIKRPCLFSRNERVITVFDTLVGSMAVIFVGALLVSSISTTWEGVVMSESFRQTRRWDYLERNLYFGHAEQLGQFKLGSSVILLLSPGKLLLDETLVSGDPVLFGQSLGRVIL